MQQRPFTDKAQFERDTKGQLISAAHNGGGQLSSANPPLLSPIPNDLLVSQAGGEILAEIESEVTPRNPKSRINQLKDSSSIFKPARCLLEHSHLTQNEITHGGNIINLGNPHIMQLIHTEPQNFGSKLSAGSNSSGSGRSYLHRDGPGSGQCKPLFNEIHKIDRQPVQISPEEINIQEHMLHHGPHIDMSSRPLKIDRPMAVYQVEQEEDEDEPIQKDEASQNLQNPSVRANQLDLSSNCGKIQHHNMRKGKTQQQLSNNDLIILCIQKSTSKQVMDPSLNKDLIKQLHEESEARHLGSAYGGQRESAEEEIMYLVNHDNVLIKVNDKAFISQVKSNSFQIDSALDVPNAIDQFCVPSQYQICLFNRQTSEIKRLFSPEESSEEQMSLITPSQLQQKQMMVQTDRNYHHHNQFGAAFDCFYQEMQRSSIQDDKSSFYNQRIQMAQRHINFAAQDLSEPFNQANMLAGQHLGHGGAKSLLALNREDSNFTEGNNIGIAIGDQSNKSASQQFMKSNGRIKNQTQQVFVDTIQQLVSEDSVSSVSNSPIGGRNAGYKK
ncbi:hypothetical protein FGO68_gene4 [Halteria grandinella]|uniref:Uncharacterized protein n=1 Tax=Halteria grandinella TaxID=5974 RepID=A0A8J8NTW8_HALGN|nr:hypothetical protein FGO68_gene4 [Halteria grandinella]